MSAAITVLFDPVDVDVARHLGDAAFLHDDPDAYLAVAAGGIAIVVQTPLCVLEGKPVAPLPLEHTYRRLYAAGASEVRWVQLPSDYKSVKQLVDHADGGLAAWRGFLGAAQPVSSTYQLAPWDPGGAGPRWPMPLGPAAMTGLIGDFIRLILPATEADPAAMAASLLTAFGSCVGRGPHLEVESAQHHANLFALIVGPTSVGRKGTSLERAMSVMRIAAPEWADNCVSSGLSTGEGLIYHVRDARHGEDKKGQKVVEDPGVSDKRLLAKEAEFGRTLTAMSRQGNTLGNVLRESWDGARVLATMVKSSPDKATEAHVSVIAHIVGEEFKSKLADADVWGGTVNRFLIVMSDRSKLLPLGRKVPADQLEALARRLGHAIDVAATRGLMDLDSAAKLIFSYHYPRLAVDADDLLDAVTGRSAPMALRIAMLYALLDQRSVIEGPDILAGLEWVRYSTESAYFLFGGGGTGDRDADAALAYLLDRPEGVLRSVVQAQVFSGHRDVRELDAIRDRLVSLDLIKVHNQPGGGRTGEVWIACAKRERSERSEAG